MSFTKLVFVVSLINGLRANCYYIYYVSAANDLTEIYYLGLWCLALANRLAAAAVPKLLRV